MRIDTNTTTATTQPDVTMPRDLAEWLAALVEAFPEIVKKHPR